jgi:hypothetical protein
MLSSEMFNAPQEASSSSTASDYIQPTLNHALRVWWAFYWRTSLLSGILTVAAAYGLRQLYENTNTSAFWIGWAQKIIPYALFYFVAVFVIRSLLHKRFRHFRMALSALGPPSLSQLALQPTFARALRVWWIYSWRSAVYSLVAWVVISYPMGLTVGLFAPSPPVMALLAFLLGIAIAAGVGLFVVYTNVLDEDIDDFHVSLLPQEKVQTAPVQAALGSPSPERLPNEASRPDFA